MSDAERPSSTDQETTVIRGKDEFYARNGGETKQNLADKLMGRRSGQGGQAGHTGQSSNGVGRKPQASSSTSASAPAPAQSPEQARQPGIGRQPAAGGPELTSSNSSGRPLETTGAAVSGVPAPAKQGTAPRSGASARPVEPEPGSTERRDTLPAEDSTAAKVGAVLKGRPNTTRRTRKARLRLASIDPWSVMKMAFLFSIAVGVAVVVATAVVWFVIGQSGLFDSINKMVNDVFSTPGDTTPFDLSQYLSAGRIIGSAVLLSVIDIVLFTALATVGAFLYNTGATLLGGVELTLADD